jgi:hypothetical protein
MMPDWEGDKWGEEDMIPWDCDGGDDDIENYDHDSWPTGLGED